MATGGCVSHIFIEESVKRYEETLKELRQDNAKHQLLVAHTLAEIGEQLKTVDKIEVTLNDHNRRRDDDKGTCEEHRADLRADIQGVEQRQSGKNETIFKAIEKVEEKQTKINDAIYLEVGKVKTRQDRKEGMIALITGISAASGATLTLLYQWFAK